MNFPFSIYGGIVSGFQRKHANSGIAIGSSVVVAIVNVAVLKAGSGLVPLVLSPALFRRNRLREVTGFSGSLFHDPRPSSVIARRRCLAWNGTARLKVSAVCDMSSDPCHVIRGRSS